MSLATLSPTPDDFDDLEFAAIVADFDQTQPLGEPMPDEVKPEAERARRVPRQRTSRAVEVRAAIDESLNVRRHRRCDREA